MAEATEISSEIVRLALHEIVEKTLKSKDNQIHVNLASKSGANNFIGIVYRASFSKKDETETEKNPVHTLIVKVAPRHPGRRQRFQVRSLFLREIFMYEKVSRIDSLVENFGTPMIKSQF